VSRQPHLLCRLPTPDVIGMAGMAPHQPERDRGSSQPRRVRRRPPRGSPTRLDRGLGGHGTGWVSDGSPAWHGRIVGDPSRQIIDAFDAELGRTMQVSASSLKACKCRLLSLRQVLFEIGVHDKPTRRRPSSRTLEQRFADVPRPIRTVLLRYVPTRASVLRPKVGGVAGQRPAAIRVAPHRPPHPTRPRCGPRNDGTSRRSSSSGTAPGPGAAAERDHGRSAPGSRSRPRRPCGTC
jgi:hypothetical protein